MNINAEASSSTSSQMDTHSITSETPSSSILEKRRDQLEAVELKILTNRSEHIVDNSRTLGASSSTSHQLDTYPSPSEPSSSSIIDKPLDQLEAVQLETPTNLSEPITTYTHTQSLSDNPQFSSLPLFEGTTLEGELAKKERQLKAARKELDKVNGEKRKLKQEVVSTQNNT